MPVSEMTVELRTDDVDAFAIDVIDVIDGDDSDDESNIVRGLD